MARGSRPRADRTARIGGKGAALAAASAAGLPVPRFVCLTTDEVSALVTGGDAGVVARARVERAVAEVGAGRLAIRSSAQAEDGARSFAGQFDTRLDVRPEEVIPAVVDVAASARRDRAMTYSRATGAGSGGLAVVVQAMVTGRWSGVAFSRDPLTYQPEVLVEAVEGAADGLVGGSRTPTRARFERPDPSADLPDAPSWLEQRDPVPAEVLGQAARLAVRCEEVLGAPQDVEWTHDGARMHLLQSRPLTGFEVLEVYSDTWSAEVWPGLITPLVFDVGDTAVNAAWGRILTSVAGPVDVEWRRMAGLAASRVYFNETLLVDVLARAGLPANVLETIVRAERPRLRDGSPARLALSMGRLVRFLAVNARWLDRVQRDVPALRARVRGTTEAVSAAGPAELAALFPELLELLEESAYLSAVTTLSLGLRAQYARAATRLLTGASRDSSRSVASAGTAPLRALGRVSAALATLPERDRAVVASGDQDRIVAALAESPAGRLALAEMAALLERWGHVASVNTDFATPAWRDEPGRLWRLALASRPPGAPGAAAPGQRVAPSPGVRGRVLRGRQDVLRSFLAARDEVNDVLALAYDAWRQAARAAGAALAPGILPDAGSVHFLDLDELTSALLGSPAPDLARRAADRAERLEGDRALVPPHRLWNLRLPERDRMAPDARPRQAVAGILRGVPAGPGTVEGHACVVRTAAEADRLRPGEILVADHADVGWTPLFTIAGGVVTGAGGALSHAAVVARELGIPAVVGLEDATRLIGDGARLRVDGSEGTVHIVESAGPGAPGPEGRR